MDFQDTVHMVWSSFSVRSQICNQSGGSPPLNADYELITFLQLVYKIITIIDVK